MLFKNDKAEAPHISQPEREAVIDLLHLCLYGDSHIALREGEFISDVVEIIGWETQSSFGSYEARSISSARAAKEDAFGRKEFLSYAAERLKSSDSRALAIDLCKQLLAVDGSVSSTENTLLGEIRTALK